MQLPLPAHIDAARVLEAIDPEKDVDGFHPINAGRLSSGVPGLVPVHAARLPDAAPAACGRSSPGSTRSWSGARTSSASRWRSCCCATNCTVTVAHSRTRDLPAVCRRADILVAAVGRPEMVRGDWIKPGAVVIDVGINRVPDPAGEGKTRLVGDVAFAEAREVAGAITPVPGGVGPMTIACLLRNTVEAACRRRGLPDPWA